MVHDRDFSMFKPAGDASYCSSVHGVCFETRGGIFTIILRATVLLESSGPHCPQLRDRFAEDAPLAELVDMVAGQPEMEWWSSGSKDRTAPVQFLCHCFSLFSSGYVHVCVCVCICCCACVHVDVYIMDQAIPRSKSWSSRRMPTGWWANEWLKLIQYIDSAAFVFIWFVLDRLMKNYDRTVRVLFKSSWLFSLLVSFPLI